MKEYVQNENISSLTKKIRNIGEYRSCFNNISKEAYCVEKLLAEVNKHNESWDLIGYCQCCEKEAKFKIDWLYSNGNMPNYRERAVCSECGLNNRQRYVSNYLKSLIKDFDNIEEKTIYCYEQVTSFYEYVKSLNKNYNFNLIGSEYLGYDKKPGEVINGLRHEDALNLSFQDESIDIIVSNDVYEHVPDIEKAMQEAYRVLKKGGKLIFSIPFYASENKTKKRAELRNGEIQHIMPNQYHGNPVSEEGSLVFYDFGWDLMDICKRVGFNDSYMLSYYSLFYGYLGFMQFIFVAEKSKYRFKLFDIFKKIY